MVRGAQDSIPIPLHQVPVVLDPPIAQEGHHCRTRSQAARSRVTLWTPGWSSASLPPAVHALVDAAGDNPLTVVSASDDERADHDARLNEMRERAGHCPSGEPG